jgi:hypothetical protein
MMEKKISLVQPGHVYRVWIMIAFGWALASRSTVAWPRWSDPLSTMTNTRGALARAGIAGPGGAHRLRHTAACS